jgi:hypothetical protein
MAGPTRSVDHDSYVRETGNCRDALLVSCLARSWPIGVVRLVSPGV